MARLSDSRVHRVLACVPSSVAWRVTSDWLELTCPLPPEVGDLDDAQALRLNAWLHGASRLVRPLDAGLPYVQADVALDAGEDLDDAVASACLDLAYAGHVAHAGPDPVTTEWVLRDGDAPGSEPARFSSSRDIVTRGGTYRARVEESGPHTRVIVELGDLSGYSNTALRAASALLVAVGAAVPGVRPALSERGGDLVAVCAAPVRTISERHLARALMAVSAACDACGRELLALRHDSLAAAYLRCAFPAHESPHTYLEEQSCMQP